MSEDLPAPAASNTFERIKRVSPEGHESWSARDLARVLEYSEFRHFLPVIEKAREACLHSTHRVEDHFEPCYLVIRGAVTWRRCCAGRWRRRR